MRAVLHLFLIFFGLSLTACKFKHSNAGACPIIKPGSNYVTLDCMKEAKSYFIFTLICPEGEECKVHGLWPQFGPRAYPIYCAAVENVSTDVYQRYSADMIANAPDATGGTGVEWLMDHEYDKHGSCALKDNKTLSAQEYFALVHALYQKYKDPRALDPKYVTYIRQDSPAVCLDRQFELMECPSK